jgi:hypothetical protein
MNVNRYKCKGYPVRWTPKDKDIVETVRRVSRYICEEPRSEHEEEPILYVELWNNRKFIYRHFLYSYYLSGSKDRNHKSLIEMLK